MALPDWYLVAGCLHQTVWNVVTGQPPEAGILGYDLACFDGSDLPWEADDVAIRAGQTVFAGCPRRCRSATRPACTCGVSRSLACPARA